MNDNSIVQISYSDEIMKSFKTCEIIKLHVIDRELIPYRKKKSTQLIILTMGTLL